MNTYNDMFFGTTNKALQYGVLLSVGQTLYNCQKLFNEV